MSKLMKVFCDFCGKEIVTAKAGETWYTITWNGRVTEMQRDICNECFDERLVAIKSDKPIIEPSADFIYDKLAEWLEAPCNWSFDGIGDMDDFMYEKCGNWCDKVCGNDDWAACWRKLFEVMANENNNN